MNKMRLVIQSHQNHPHGIYSGTDRIYILQVEDDHGVWRTMPVVQFDDLQDHEKQELLENQGGGV